MTDTGPPDTSAGSVTQGGAPDAGSPGPARVRGRSIWWIAMVGVVLLVVAAFQFAHPHRRAPAEAGKTAISGPASGSTSQAHAAALAAAP